jgi:hypothetical protein
MALVLWNAAPALAAPQNPDRLQAAMIYNIAKFVRWPPSPDAVELRLCLHGAAPVARQLQAVVGRSVSGRALAVAQPDRPGAGCELLVYGEQAQFSAPAPAGALTVGMSADFLESGGMIALSVVRNKLVFDVHLTRLRAAGFDLSAEVLALARSVHR